MATGYKATDYHWQPTAVSFTSDAKWLQELHDRCEYFCKQNTAIFTDKKVLREGSDYDGVWLETQPMGGEMYAKRDMEAALNNQLIFIENQRKSGRLPGMIKFQEPFLLQVSYDWLQGFCFPVHALKMYYMIGRDASYLQKLYETLVAYDHYLWTYRDSDNDGCLESWCTWDTGEDNSLRFTRYGVKDGGFGGEDAPIGHGRLPYESMDVMSYSCQCRDVLATICTLSEKLEESKIWRDKANQVRKKIKDYLWREDKNACYDRDCDNLFMDVLTHNNLRCMYYGSFDQEMADRFIRHHLFNPEEFWTPIPLPSIAANDPCFSNINFNNWGGQVQGLTYQRAIQALEQYGHEAEIRMLGKKWLFLLRDQKKLVQQYDPFTGAPCVTRSEGLAPQGEETERYASVTTLGPEGYGPTILAALEYISLLCGINIAFDEIRWSAVLGWPSSSYVQTMHGHDYRLEQNGTEMTAFMDQQKLFTCSCGVQIRTDLNGKPLSVTGIEESSVPLRLQTETQDCNGTVFPNQVLCPTETSFIEIQRISFDYPYKHSEK
ncbi:MAG: trehalase family glycosidase [Eubacteriales bacterium]|nr:trehalase family glycosidase [Eubacteriales bacterium]